MSELEPAIAPLVSIITPNFNGSRFLRDTIESVLAQTFLDWEMLIVDDGSTDGSDKIIEEYALYDPRIKALKTDLKKFPKLCPGPAAARNTAINASKGRYIAFLDSDDIWCKTKLARQIDFMVKNSFELSYTGYNIINEVGIIVDEHLPTQDRLSYNDLLKDNKIGCLTVMYDSMRLGKQSIDLNEYDLYADYSLWLKITKMGYNAFYLPENLSSYRLVKDSISANKFRAIKQQWLILTKIEKLNFLFALYNFCFYATNGFTRKLKYIVPRFF